LASLCQKKQLSKGSLPDDNVAVLSNKPACHGDADPDRKSLGGGHHRVVACGGASGEPHGMPGICDAGFGDIDAITQNAATKPDAPPVMAYMIYSKAPCTPPVIAP
jgi:hypothetical protein